VVKFLVHCTSLARLDLYINNITAYGPQPLSNYYKTEHQPVSVPRDSELAVPLKIFD
jgi:hypothetical protein